MEGRFSYNFGPFGVAKLVEDEGMLVLVFSWLFKFYISQSFSLMVFLAFSKALFKFFSL